MAIADTLNQHYDGCLQGPTGGWKKGFSANVLNLELWNSAFPDCQVERIGSGGCK